MFGIFIDFKKAYDRVYHGQLFKVLENKEVRKHFLNLIKTMYGNTLYTIKIGNYISKSFSPTYREKQGDPLSPILFILYINDFL
jgi:hypothetical protein